MSQTQPEISVVIPTYNRRDVILDCLAHLDRQTIDPARMEVIVIDDGSKDGTAAAVKDAATRMTVAVQCEHQPNGGASVARNRGLGLARGRIILIINDDTLATPGMLEAHLRLHERHPEEGVAALGPLAISPRLPDSIYLHLHHSTMLDDLPDEHELGWHMFATFNISAKAALLRRTSGFETWLRWYEDTELGRRLVPLGLKILLAKDALGIHYHPMDEQKYFRIADSDGAAMALWYQRNPELLPELIPLGLHSSRLGTRAWRHILADVAINRATYPILVTLARATADVARGPSMMLYRKLFQWRRRRALDKGLAKVT